MCGAARWGGLTDRERLEPSYPRSVTFGRHVRRHAHRVATAPRRAWRRTYSIKEERAGWPLSGIVFRTPISTDAPYSDEDAHFWDLMFAGLLGIVALGVVVWLLVAFM